MTPEEETILFAVLQDIANELRRIEREEREAKKSNKQTEISSFGIEA